METEEASVQALKCEQSVLSRADGSVMFSQGIYFLYNFSDIIREVLFHMTSL